MSKILFINPSATKVMASNPWNSKLTKILKGENTAFLPKLAGMILAALTPEEHTFTFVDDEIEDIDYRADADIVALTAMTEQACRVYQIAGEFRKRGITVVVGGIHATVMPDEVKLHCDAVMIGEAENMWPALLKDYENGVLKPVYNAGDYPPVETLVSPRIGVIKHHRYLSFPIQATRGCPYSCEFCSIKHSSGNRYRMKPVQQVVNEILEYEKYNIPGFAGAHRKGYYFVDDNMYVHREYVKELLTALIPLNINWDGQGTANIAKDEEILKLMALSGCRSFGVGFESLMPESIKEANKTAVNKVDEYKTLVQNIAKNGIITAGFFVFGFDGDDLSVFQRTRDFIEQSRLLQPTISVLTPYPGTKLHERIKDRIFNTSCFFYNSWACVFTPKQMSMSELIQGSLSVGRHTTELGFMRKQLKAFWSYGPWERNPTLRIDERVALIYLGIKMGLNGLWEYQRFLFWASVQRKAVDFKTIIWTLRRRELHRSLDMRV